MISVRNVYKDFGELKVLRGVSSEIEKGERWLLSVRPVVERVPS